MRVIAGKFKGRTLATVRSNSVRYTSDRVRESLFAIVRNLVPGSSFLDLFAGVGSVGIEAISRGADFVLFVEKNPRCVRTICENLSSCGVDPRGDSVQILQKDALRALRVIEEMGLKFDLIFLDPPYGSPVLEKALRKLAGVEILRDDGMVIAEHPFKSSLPQQIGEFVRVREEKYGDTVLTFYKRRKT
jgi:16S rRNA (guanine(966)-N(2))-methyltransferase RsmD